AFVSPAEPTMTATDTPAVPPPPAPRPDPARDASASAPSIPRPVDHTSARGWPWWALLVRGLAVLILIGAGAAVFGMLRASAPTLNVDEAQRSQTRVLIYEPVAVPVQRPFRGYGTARALDATNVPARVTATVASVPPTILDGARVEAGDVLVELDPTDFSAEAQRLDAALSELDATLDQIDSQEARLTERLALEEEDLTITANELARVQRLADRNVANDQDLDRARSAELASRRSVTLTRETLDALPPRRAGIAAQRAGLEAQRTLAQENLQRTTIVAPIAGVLQSVAVEPGESVAPGQQVARIVDPKVIEVPIALPAASQSAVRLGDVVKLRPTNDSARAFEATVARVSPEIDPQSRSLTVYALRDQTQSAPEDRLAPGTFVEADVLTGDLSPRLVIPRRAIRRQRVQAIVPNEAGVPTLVSVSIDPLFPLRMELPATGLTDDEWAVLPDDALPEDTAILATGSSTLLDGQAVTPVTITDPPRPHPTDGDPQLPGAE
ncbi:MAG: HlyD family efflux transporter periplasmic adaptor subunit, partial [Planctomycetota bacterium]